MKANRSLGFQILVSASIVLAAFFAIVAIVLEQGFRESAEQGLKEKLQVQIYALLSAAEMTPSGRLKMQSNLHESLFSKPGSGLYAYIHRSDRKLLWRTPSAIGLEIEAPKGLKPGEFLFLLNRNGNFTLHYGVIWEMAPGREKEFIFSVEEDAQFVVNQVKSFRKILWSWLSAIGALLVIIQFFVLRWNLKPLREIGQDLEAIETGEKSRLSGNYPFELQGLAGNLNALISSERAHLERYRNTLADLAHSLKTPLAILRGILESPGITDDVKETLKFQIGRMDEIVEYQLKRAAAKGRKQIAGTVEAAAVMDKIIASLKKVYAEKHINFDVAARGDTKIYCEEGDFYEIAGNLIDNACKWCRQRINITLDSTPHAAFCLIVEDDGPGIPEDKLGAILKRGIRADETVKGHGIGMAVVNELVNLLGGRLKGEKSASLGGMKWVVSLP
ncbi:MAG: ATP-binding protein [Gammaproteobacteria bacterium]